jgi:Transmembrane secretion effector
MQTLLGDKDYNFELEALQNPTFSRLWFATVVSGICLSAHDTAATCHLDDEQHQPIDIAPLPDVDYSHTPVFPVYSARSVRSTFAFRRSGILWFNTFRMEMMVPSWTQYLSQQDRMTKADREIIEQAESLHLAPNHPPEIRMYLGVNKELPS